MGVSDIGQADSACVRGEPEVELRREPFMEKAII